MPSGPEGNMENEIDPLFTGEIGVAINEEKGTDPISSQEGGGRVFEINDGMDEIYVPKVLTDADIKEIPLGAIPPGLKPEDLIGATRVENEQKQ